MAAAQRSPLTLPLEDPVAPDDPEDAAPPDDPDDPAPLDDPDDPELLGEPDVAPPSFPGDPEVLVEPEPPTDPECPDDPEPLVDPALADDPEWLPDVAALPELEPDREPGLIDVAVDGPHPPPLTTARTRALKETATESFRSIGPRYFAVFRQSW